MESLMTPVQREHFALLKECMGHAVRRRSRCRRSRHGACPALEPALPLSMASGSDRIAGRHRDSGETGRAMTIKATKGRKVMRPPRARRKVRVTPKPAPKAVRTPAGCKINTCWRKNRLPGDCTGRKDFIRGKQLGTDVTSKGNLVIAPAVRSIYQTTEMIPWKVASAGKNIYLAGWNSDQVIHLDAD